MQEFQIRGFIYGDLQTYTTGAAYTVTSSLNNIWVMVDPSASLGSASFTLPPVPIQHQEVRFSFGGTLASGTTVVSALTITGSTGQSIRDYSPVTASKSGQTLIYRYRTSGSLWYRIV
jgi:hypothetical protein